IRSVSSCGGTVISQVFIKVSSVPGRTLQEKARSEQQRRKAAKAANHECTRIHTDDWLTFSLSHQMGEGRDDEGNRRTPRRYRGLAGTQLSGHYEARSDQQSRKAAKAANHECTRIHTNDWLAFPLSHRMGEGRG